MKNVKSEMTVENRFTCRIVCPPPAPAVCRLIFCPRLDVSLYSNPSFCAPLVTALR